MIPTRSALSVQYCLLSAWTGVVGKAVTTVARAKSQTLNWETKQAYIAMTALLYGAASLGIDSTPIEGFDENKMDKLLNLDNYGVHSVLVVTLGYDAEDDHNRTRPKSRLEQSKIFFDLDKFPG